MNRFWLLSGHTERGLGPQEMGYTRNMSITYFQAQGERHYQEDRLVAQTIKLNELELTILAVMDGHGGGETSEMLSKALVGTIMQSIHEVGYNWGVILKDSVAQLNNMTQHMTSGSTLSLVLLLEHEKIAHVAVIGDSPIIILDTSGRLNLSPDHNARSNEIERQAAINRGATYDNQYLRDPVTGDGLQMSRSMGDSTMASFLSREPDVYDVELGPHSFVIVASDGVLDPFHEDTSSQERRLAEMVAKGADAKTLVEDALARKTGDNATAIVLKSQ